MIVLQLFKIIRDYFSLQANAGQHLKKGIFDLDRFQKSVFVQTFNKPTLAIQENSVRLPMSYGKIMFFSRVKKEMSDYVYSTNQGQLDLEKAARLQ